MENQAELPLLPCFVAYPVAFFADRISDPAACAAGPLLIPRGTGIRNVRSIGSSRTGTTACGCGRIIFSQSHFQFCHQILQLLLRHGILRAEGQAAAGAAERAAASMASDGDIRTAARLKARAYVKILRFKAGNRADNGVAPLLSGRQLYLAQGGRI